MSSVLLKRILEFPMNLTENTKLCFDELRRFAKSTKIDFVEKLEMTLGWVKFLAILYG